MARHASVTAVCHHVNQRAHYKPFDNSISTSVKNQRTTVPRLVLYRH